jgi:hypothetical protein
MQDIVNTMLNTCTYPLYWKQSQIRPIPKTKCPSKLSDFRPISLLFHLGKVAEDIILKKMSSVLQGIQPTQYAFRKGMGVGTTDALIKVVDEISSINDKKKSGQILCIDFSKAFDRLQPNLLKDKMISLNMNTNLCKLIGSFLSHRKQSVKLAN